MKKRMTLMLIGVTLLFCLIFGWWGFKQYMMGQFIAHYHPAPVNITATSAKEEVWRPYISATGTFVAINGVDITSQAAGLVTGIDFHSGQKVDKGTILVSLDTRVDQANLKNDEAALTLASIDYSRSQQLLVKNAVSKAVYDSDRAKLKEAKAAVERDEALISQKNISAPFSGKLGIRQVNIGDYISPGKALVTLQQLDPLYVHFSLPEQNLSQIRTNQQVQVRIDAYPKQVFIGEINAINSKVNLQTRSFLVQATIPNPHNELLPGMFANVHVILPVRDHVVTVPQTAISYSLYGDAVYVLEAEKTKHKKDTKHDKHNKKAKSQAHKLYFAMRRSVTVGSRRDAEVAITHGLKPGQLVVTSGQVKLSNHTEVLINNKVEP